MRVNKGLSARPTAKHPDHPASRLYSTAPRQSAPQGGRRRRARRPTPRPAVPGGGRAATLRTSSCWPRPSRLSAAPFDPSARHRGTSQNFQVDLLCAGSAIALTITVPCALLNASTKPLTRSSAIVVPLYLSCTASWLPTCPFMISDVEECCHSRDMLSTKPLTNSSACHASLIAGNIVTVSEGETGSVLFFCHR